MSVNLESCGCLLAWLPDLTTCDVRFEQPDWNNTHHQSSHWTNVAVIKRFYNSLSPQLQSCFRILNNDKELPVDAFIWIRSHRWFLECYNRKTFDQNSEILNLVHQCFLPDDFELLTGLRWFSKDADYVLDFISKCPKLTCLQMDAWNDNVPGDIYLQPLVMRGVLQRLIVIRFGGVRIPDFASLRFASNLEDLSFDEAFITTENLIETLPLLRKLDELHIRCHPDHLLREAFVESLQTPSLFLPQLRKFSFGRF